MENELQILFPHETITLRGKPVTVSELAWPQALEFLRLLAEHAGRLVKVGADGTIQGQFGLAQLRDVVLGAAELTDFLLLHSCTISREQLAELRTSEVLTLLERALAWNLNEDLLKKVAALGQRLQALAPGASVSARFTTSSSGRDTPAPTSTA